MWPFEHYSGTVAGAMGSKCKVMHLPYPHQRPVVFLPAVLCPCLLETLEFSVIFPKSLWGALDPVKLDCLGHLLSSSLLNYSHIMVGMVTFNMNFSENHVGSLGLYFWKLWILQLYLIIWKQPLSFYTYGLSRNFKVSDLKFKVEQWLLGCRQ